LEDTLRKVIGNLFFWLQMLLMIALIDIGVHAFQANPFTITVGLVVAIALLYLWYTWSMSYKIVVIGGDLESKAGIGPVVLGAVAFVVGLIVFNPPLFASNIFIDIVLPACFVLFYIIDLVDYGIQATSK